jgi:uncharacterized protein YdaU (DUF1376 family)
MSFAYFPIYTGDYIRDTRHLTPMRNGVYLMALIYCWDSKGPLPLDEQECAGIVNARSADEIEAMRYIVDRYFVRMPDGHYNKRVMQEIERWNAISGKRADAAHTRWKAREKLQQMGEHANAKQVHSKSNASGPSPSPSPSPSLTLTPTKTRSQDQDTAPAALSGKPARKRASKPTAQTGDVWAAYAQAYKERYQVEPVRNAKVNGQLSQLIGRLGADEAPGVARAYLSNRNGLYVASKHCVDLLLRDAEKLRTEWATGNVTHRGDADQADRLGSVGNQAARVTAILNNMGVK